MALNNCKTFKAPARPPTHRACRNATGNFIVDEAVIVPGGWPRGVVGVRRGQAGGGVDAQLCVDASEGGGGDGATLKEAPSKGIYRPNGQHQEPAGCGGAQVGFALEGGSAAAAAQQLQRSGSSFRSAAHHLLVL